MPMEALPLPRMAQAASRTEQETTSRVSSAERRKETTLTVGGLWPCHLPKGSFPALGTLEKPSLRGVNAAALVMERRGPDLTCQPTLGSNIYARIDLAAFVAISFDISQLRLASHPFGITPV